LILEPASNFSRRSWKLIVLLLDQVVDQKGRLVVFDQPPPIVPKHQNRPVRIYTAPV
jgi:hypothetical protein